MVGLLRTAFPDPNHLRTQTDEETSLRKVRCEITERRWNPNAVGLAAPPFALKDSEGSRLSFRPPWTVTVQRTVAVLAEGSVVLEVPGAFSPCFYVFLGVSNDGSLLV